MTRVVGVDGWPRGWVAVVLDDGTFTEARTAARFADLELDAAAIVGVDIPFGSTGADRVADREARARLGPRRASVFTPPPRDLLDAPDHAAANRWCRERYGRGVSAQAWNLATKMRDAEPHWRAAPNRIFEVHPELAFMAMHDAPLLAPKHSWAGMCARVGLLAAHGVTVPDELGDAGAAGADDVLDAAAVAWSAYRIARGVAACVPEPPARDADGRPVAIWW